MDPNLESLFGVWAQPLSETEDEKCENAVGMVKKASAASSALNGRTIRVFAQGSYRNNTNVRAESDVDVAVCCSDTVNLDFTFSPSLDKYKVGFSDATDTAQQLRTEVGEALRSYFGRDGVSEGNKAFDVHSNSYRVDADVVPCIEHRRYTSEYSWETGTALYPKSSIAPIINWPEQHYANGVAKNNATGYNFKRLVRIVKNIRNTMGDEGIPEAGPIPSYLIECLVFNVPNVGFLHPTYSADVRYILSYLYAQTSTDAACHEWGEVNELKYLFRMSQPWTRVGANAFLARAMNRLAIAT
ncbi:MAG: nucleotidyltransferase [Gemmatimonadota bacterium]|nr:nucleotidyltransferase [Gemmatimonadota bacterium]